MRQRPTALQSGVPGRSCSVAELAPAPGTALQVTLAATVPQMLLLTGRLAASVPPAAAACCTCCKPFPPAYGVLLLLLLLLSMLLQLSCCLLHCLQLLAFVIQQPLHFTSIRSAQLVPDGQLLLALMVLQHQLLLQGCLHLCLVLRCRQVSSHKCSDARATGVVHHWLCGCS